MKKLKQNLVVSCILLSMASPVLAQYSSGNAGTQGKTVQAGVPATTGTMDSTNIGNTSINILVNTQPANPCNTTTLEFGNGCWGQIGSAASGGTATVTNDPNNEGYNGSATFSCSNGTWSVVSATCNFTGVQSCEPQIYEWSDGQCDVLTSEVPNTFGHNFTNTAPGYTGSVLVYCENGVLVPHSSTCQPQ